MKGDDLEKWQEEIEKSFNSVGDLLAFLELERSEAPYGLAEKPLCVTRSFASRMRKKDWFDPLLLQMIPRDEEDEFHEGFTDDAVGDGASVATSGLLHKYRSRILFLTTYKCAVKCRFCFRKEYDISEYSLPDGNAWDYVSRHPEVNEIVLSGGDPLMIENDKLKALFENIGLFQNITAVRIHTRIPVVLPSRLDNDILSLLKQAASTRILIVVAHVNHANELDGGCAESIRELRKTGAIVLSQTVLLKGVNDTPDRLCDLSRSLVKHGIIPYYVHQLDKVKGTHHFEVPVTKGRELLEELRSRLPGYAVPRYVREIPGAESKVPL